MRMSPRVTILLLAILLPIAACKHTAEGAATGAARGAIAGAAGGLLSALVFGGDPAERAARGATWGAGWGAAAGAMSGAQRDEAERRRERDQAQAELAKLKREIGDDCFRGLEALADGKHKVALAYAETGAKSRNRDHALAALWLELLVHADTGDLDAARSLYPEVIERDPEMHSAAETERATKESIRILNDIRAEYGLKRSS